MDLRAKSEKEYGEMKEAEGVLLNNLNIEWTYILLEVRFKRHNAKKMCHPVQITLENSLGKYSIGDL